METITINAKEISWVGSGRSKPLRYQDLLIKLEESPDWESLPHRESAFTDVNKEFKAYQVVKMLGVYTPQVSLSNIVLKDGEKTFKTCASIRKWQELQSFTSLAQLCLFVPVIFKRIDFQYILIADFLVANFDRRPCNILYEKTRDVLVPIDYDASFSYDKLPCTVEGVKTLFSHYIEEPILTGMLDFSVFVFGEVFAHIKSQVNYSLLQVIDERLIERVLNSSDAFRDYLIQFNNLK